MASVIFTLVVVAMAATQGCTVDPAELRATGSEPLPVYADSRGDEIPMQASAEVLRDTMARHLKPESSFGNGPEYEGPSTRTIRVVYCQFGGQL